MQEQNHILKEKTDGHVCHTEITKYGKAIKEYREHNNINRMAFARQLGMSTMNLYRWEEYGKKVSPLWVRELKRLGIVG